MVKNPSYLYHYTNITTLALILKSKKIRLSTLNTVDDISETKSTDLVNFGQYVFVTCWTSLEEESLPFWHMYTKDMSGVRIKLPNKMFIEYPNRDVPEYGFKTDNTGFFAVPFEEANLSNYIILPSIANEFYPIEYTDDKSLLYPKLYKVNSDKSKSVAIQKLGVYKSKHWSFQSEWRFRLNIIPGIPMKKNTHSDPSELTRYINAASAIEEGKSIGIDEYFLKLNDEAFSQMEIMLGPKQKAGEIILVESLAKEFNPSANIIQSELKDLIQ